MKLNKKMMTLALAGAMLAMTVCGAQAKELKGGLKNGMVGGAKNGLTNGATAGLKNGMAGGAKNGLTNGATAGLKNGMAGGVKDGLKNGIVSGMTSGLKNGIINGLVNGDVQQVLDAETLAQMLESGDLTQEEYNALIAALDSETDADSDAQIQTRQ